MKNKRAPICWIFITTITWTCRSIAATDADTAKQTVSEFQRLPQQTVLCLKENWDGSAYKQLEPTFDKFFSAQFIQLFSWAQCGMPPMPAPTTSFYWDFRYGIPEKSKPENVRVLVPKMTGRAVASVTVLFDWGSLKNLSTTYQLTIENRKWKIDDIRLGGYETNSEVLVQQSKSLKADMQAAYRRAADKGNGKAN